MQPFRRILVALACADTDGALLEYARMIAGWDTAVRFDLVHCVSPGEGGEDEALRRIRSAAEEVFRGAPRVEYSVVRGDRLDGLLRFAATVKADLILLGHGRNRSGRRSLARRLAMTAPCSVWLVPEGSPAKLERVLAPVDYSRRSADALGAATAIAAAAGLDECFGLHVRFDRAVATFDEYRDIEMAEEREAFYLFIAPIDLHGVTVLPLYEEGPNVAASIQRVAAERDCDLVVMGTRGRSTAASVLLGSETEQTIIASRRPVLAVKRYGARLRFLEALLKERFRKGGDLRFG